MKKILLVCTIISVLSIWVWNNYLQEPKALNDIDNQPTIPNLQTDVPYKVELYANNLQVPWSIIFTTTSRMLVSERQGSIREVKNGALQTEPLITFSEISTQAEEGLMGMAKDPEYSTNKYLYVCLAYPKKTGLVDKIVRLIDKQDSIVVDTIILDDIPAAKFHAGCRIAFGPDKKLYITTGDATDKEIAQDLNSLGGKILRINSDGSIPDDNPFTNSPIYSFGHRNPQGISWHPKTKELYSTEHGPSTFDGPPGGDEVNRIVKGGNYGWPLVSHQRTKDGAIPPLIIYTPAAAPASALVYSGKVFPQFTHNLFFGGLNGEGIYRLTFDENNPDVIIDTQKIPEVKVGRIREIIEGPDGYIYFSTSNRDGRGSPNNADDKIYRLVPLTL